MRTLLVLLAASRADETCLPCDYDNLRVPRSVAFRLPDAKFYVDHTDGKDASFDAIFRYWDDVRAANGTTPETACNTPLAAPNAVAALAKVARRGARKGALVAFVGDSFMRIAWQRLVQTLARGSAAVLRGTQFNGKTYHMDHVVCCPAVSLEPFSTAPLNADARPGEGCLAWTAPPADRLEFADDRLRSSLKRGDVCIAQYMAGAAWTQTRDFLQKAVEMGLAPDLLAVDSGLGYKDHDDGGVSRAFDAWLDVTAPHLATNGTHLVVVTPTHNPFYGWLNPLAPTQNEFRSSWRSETATYEHIRETIALLPPEVRRLISTAPLAQIAAVDACGLSTRFPHRSYAKVPRADADETRRHCNGGWRPLDIHLGGGAYLYLLEFLLLPLAAEARLCDAAPYRPAAESDLAREVLPKFVRSMRYSPGCVDPATGVLKPRATRARHCGVPRQDGYG